MRRTASVVAGETLHASQLLHTCVYENLVMHLHMHGYTCFLFLYTDILIVLMWLDTYFLFMRLFLYLYPHMMMTVAWRRGISHGPGVAPTQALSWLLLRYCPCSLAWLWLYWRFFGRGFPSTPVPQNKDLEQR